MQDAAGRSVPPGADDFRFCGNTTGRRPALLRGPHPVRPPARLPSAQRAGRACHPYFRYVLLSTCPAWTGKARDEGTSLGQRIAALRPYRVGLEKALFVRPGSGRSRYILPRHAADKVGERRPSVLKSEKKCYDLFLKLPALRSDHLLKADALYPFGIAHEGDFPIVCASGVFVGHDDRPTCPTILAIAITKGSAPLIPLCGFATL